MEDKPAIYVKSIEQINDKYTNVKFERDDLEALGSEDAFL